MNNYTLAAFLVSTFIVSSHAPDCGAQTQADPTIRSAPSIEGAKFKSYLNPRFNYAVHFPDWMQPLPEAENSDGRKFIDKKGKLEFIVYGHSIFATPDGTATDIKETFDEQKSRWLKDGYTISYERRGKSFFALSGKSKKSVFYQKGIIDSAAVKFLEFNYPLSAAKEMDPTVAKISKSFKNTIPSP